MHNTKRETFTRNGWGCFWKYSGKKICYVGIDKKQQVMRLRARFFFSFESFFHFHSHSGF